MWDSHQRVAVAKDHSRCDPKSNAEMRDERTHTRWLGRQARAQGWSRQGTETWGAGEEEVLFSDTIREALVL